MFWGTIVNILRVKGIINTTNNLLNWKEPTFSSTQPHISYTFATLSTLHCITMPFVSFVC